MLMQPVGLKELTAKTFGASQWLMARERRWVLYLATSLVALGTFLEISEDLVDDSHLLALDTRILEHVAALRHSWLTIHAVDLTALGSVTLLSLVSLVVGIALLRLRDQRASRSWSAPWLAWRSGPSA
ncbi:MAG: hypothetical protein JWN04_6347 [Myxococcaceae bacterium]|nr:hypothetical protein [Myxococcaceae bacterium]